MKIADESTILTNKLVALSDRRMPVARDLFGGYYFLKLGFKLNEKLITERKGKTLEEYIEFLVPFIERTYNDKRISFMAWAKSWRKNKKTGLKKN